MHHNGESRSGDGVRVSGQTPAVPQLQQARVFRSMRGAADGLPVVGPTARTLGVRLEIDIPVDAYGMVRPGAGGLSVSPESPVYLPTHRRPPEFGGTGNDDVWFIAVNDLGPSLLYRPDPANPAGHGFVEPARRMTAEEYQQALAATRGAWALASPWKLEVVEMDSVQQFEKALQGGQPTTCLREVVRGLLAQGYTRQTVLDELETFRRLLQQSGRLEDEDVVLEVLDFLAGWCSPHMAL
jgi:hypothetical protein